LNLFQFSPRLILKDSIKKLNFNRDLDEILTAFVRNFAHDSQRSNINVILFLGFYKIEPILASYIPYKRGTRELSSHGAKQEMCLSLLLSAELDEMPNRNIGKISNFQHSWTLSTWLIFHSASFAEMSINPASYRFRTGSAYFFCEENKKVVDYLTLNIEEIECRKRMKVQIYNKYLMSDQNNCKFFWDTFRL